MCVPAELVQTGRAAAHSKNVDIRKVKDLDSG